MNEILFEFPVAIVPATEIPFHRRSNFSRPGLVAPRFPIMII